MKKTIGVAALAISASTASLALYVPRDNMVTKTYCLSIYEDVEGGQRAGSCDETDRNTYYQRELNAQGCAEGQVALSTRRYGDEGEFPIRIGMCLPPNVAQL